MSYVATSGTRQVRQLAEASLPPDLYVGSTLCQPLAAGSLGPNACIKSSVTQVSRARVGRSNGALLGATTV
jgi:hypothetical protein